MSQLIMILVLDAVHAASSVQLRAEQLIGLDKPVKLLRQVCVLSLEYAAVTLQSLALMR